MRVKYARHYGPTRWKWTRITQGEQLGAHGLGRMQHLSVTTALTAICAIALRKSMSTSSVLELAWATNPQMQHCTPSIGCEAIA